MERHELHKKDPTEIDLYNLHIEWQVQAKYREEFGKDLADAKDALRRKKTTISYKESQIRLEYVSGKREIISEKTEKPIKLTAGDLSAAVRQDPEINILYEEALDLEAAVETANEFVKAIDQKKSALQGEVSLFIANYWANPEVRNITGLGEEEYQQRLEEKRKELDEMTQRALRRKKRDDRKKEMESGS